MSLSSADPAAQAMLIQQVSDWLDRVVIQLNLCPFAARPRKDGRVRFYLSLSQNEEDLMHDLQTEMRLLDAEPQIETTLVLIPNQLQDFFDYQQALAWAQSLLKRERWLGTYQFASFHPHYCFAGAAPDDAENLTNRSPVPIIHIIRETSLEKAIEFYKDVELIPERNKNRVKNLSEKEKRELFPYIFSGD